MNVRTALLALLRQLPGVLFVEPSREIFEQGEVHETARNLIASHGLAPDAPYVGWHSQQDAFDRSGGLTQPQRVYFGGDAATVAAALKTLEPGGFIVLGGRSKDEPFALFHDAQPTGVDPAQEDAWKTRLVALGEPYCDGLRPGEEESLHAILRSPELSALRLPAAGVLRDRGLMTPEDLDAVLTPEGLDRLEAARRPGSPSTELTATMLHAFRIGYPRAAALASDLARQGRADAAVLAAWGGPEALRAARGHAVATGRGARVLFELAAREGQDPMEAAVELAGRRRDSGAEPAVTEEIARAIAALFAQEGAPAIAALREERLPAWLRVRIGEVFLRSLRDLEESGAAREWAAAFDEVRRAAGLPPSPGFDVSNSGAYAAVIENREHMVAAHLDGLRAALRDTAVNEPGTAVLLELVHSAGALTGAELDVLLQNWKKRLLVKPGDYTPAPPAIVTLAAAALEAGRPEGGKIVAALRRDIRAWSKPHRLALIGELEADATTEARLVKDEASKQGGQRGSLDIRHALVRVNARRRGIDPVQAAAEFLVDAPEQPAYVARDFANIMISLSEPGSRLCGHWFRDRSAVSLETALALAQDVSLPLAARQLVFTLAQDSKVLRHPEHATIPPRPDELARLQTTLEQARLALKNP